MEARSTLPILVAGAVLWKTSRNLRIRKMKLPANEFAALVMLGLSIPFGTEQGAAAILSYAVVKFAAVIKRQKKLPISDVSCLALQGLFILFVAFFKITLLMTVNPLLAV